jgi:copper chaperone CopZ
MGYYYHYVLGRLRIQTPFIRGNPRNGSTFIKTLLGLDGVTSVKINPVIGSALIHFDENKIRHKQIIGILEKQGYFILAKARTSDQVIQYAAEKILENL